MKAATLLCTSIGLLLAGSGMLTAQETDGEEPKTAVAAKPAGGEDPAHNELRALRDGLLAATNKGDVDEMLKFCHPDVRFTSPDARVHRGHAGVREYLDEMLKGPNAYVKSFKATVTVDELALLFGCDTAIATGISVDQFEVAGGNKFQLTDRWSATVVKEDGKWLVADYHSAPSVFNNPILEIAKKSAYWMGGIGLLAGLAVGGIGTRLLRRSPKPGVA